MTVSPGVARSGAELDSVVDDPDPGRRHVHPVPVAGLDDLRVARDELDAGGGRGRTHRRRNLLEHRQLESLLEHERR